MRFTCTSQPKSFDIVEWTGKHFFLLHSLMRLKCVCSEWNQCNRYRIYAHEEKFIIWLKSARNGEYTLHTYTYSINKIGAHSSEWELFSDTTSTGYCLAHWIKPDVRNAYSGIGHWPQLRRHWIGNRITFHHREAGAKLIISIKEDYYVVVDLMCWWVVCGWILFRRSIFN